MKPRLRFAPSPTGFLHIGGVRTALFNWLYARRHGGTFVLRIEDTDKERSTPESVQAILDGLRWVGLTWDEGPEVGGPYAPYFQSQRLARYQEVADELIQRGFAYRDYTPAEEVERARAEFAKQQGLKPGDDLRKAGFKFKSRFRDEKAKLDAPSIIRFRHDPKTTPVAFDDLVFGPLEKDENDLDDFVLLREGGLPLYNFGCVVDDHDMVISHVVRGQEHINSTFPQLLIYRALGWAPPRYAHLPLILGADREKLSKRRHPEADVMAHKQVGILPDALLNFVVRLGFSHKDQERFTREELVQLFDFSAVGRANGAWNGEKLLALNQEWMGLIPPEELVKQVQPFMNVALPGQKRALRGVALFAPRARTLRDIATQLDRAFSRGVTVDPSAAKKHLDSAGRTMLAELTPILAALPDWSAAPLDARLAEFGRETSRKLGAIAQPLRVAVTGSAASPGIGDTLELVGREETLLRLKEAAALTSAASGPT